MGSFVTMLHLARTARSAANPFRMDRQAGWRSEEGKKFQFVFNKTVVDAFARKP